MSGTPQPDSLSVRTNVPVRTTLTIISLVVATVVLWEIVLHTRRVLTWIVIAAFFAVALHPAVEWLQRRLTRCHRALATLLVFVVVLVALGGVITAFAIPLTEEGKQLAGKLPDIVQQAREGRGPVGDFLERTNALEYVEQNRERIQAFATGLTTPAAGVLRGVATGIAGTLTILVLAYLMVLEGPRTVDGFVSLFSESTGRRIRTVGSDCARSVTGYLTGNLLISVICGALTYMVLKVAGVPFAGLIALFVAIVDLIPLVGATLGATVAAVAGFLHSVPAGIAVIVFFLVYQQLENHLLQPLIFSRTVRLNPLAVIIAILVAAELAGILGALLAIPIASMVQVVLRDVWDHRRGKPKETPTVGEEREPVQIGDEGDDDGHPLQDDGERRPVGDRDGGGRETAVVVLPTERHPVDAGDEPS